jgi:hypothetical protein
MVYSLRIPLSRLVQRAHDFPRNLEAWDFKRSNRPWP